MCHKWLTVITCSERLWYTDSLLKQEEVLVTPRHQHLYPRHSAEVSSSTKPLAKTCFCKHASQNMKLKHSGPYETHTPECISEVSDLSSRLYNTQHVKRTPQTSRPIPARSPQIWERGGVSCSECFCSSWPNTVQTPPLNPASMKEGSMQIWQTSRDSITILRRYRLKHFLPKCPNHRLRK